MSDTTQTSDEQKRVVRNDESGRYEIWVGGRLGGFTEITSDAEGRAVFPHTEVDPAFGGQGLGKILVGEALSDVARRGETIVPVCSYVRKYLRENEVPGAVVEWPNRADAQDAATPAEPA